jgi:hypothetical protein
MVAAWKGDTGDRLPDYESEGRTFESFRARRLNHCYNSTFSKAAVPGLFGART